MGDVAIENARLFQETRRRVDRLAVLAQISAAGNQPLELNAVVQAAVSELTQALHIAQTGLALFDPTRQHLIILADVQASGNPPVSGIEMPVAGNASMLAAYAAHRLAGFLRRRAHSGQGQRDRLPAGNQHGT